MNNKIDLRFLKSTKIAINDDYRAFLFIGKTNVGKSSLINFLSKNKKIAYSSKKPGKTLLFNYYVNDEHKFYIIDSPGYGYSKVSKKIIEDFGNFIDEFFNNIQNLNHVFLLINSNRKLSDDDYQMINFLEKKQINVSLIASKYDKLNQSDKHYLNETLKKLNLPFYLHSNLNKKYNNYEIIMKLISN